MNPRTVPGRKGPRACRRSVGLAWWALLTRYFYDRRVCSDPTYTSNLLVMSAPFITTLLSRPLAALSSFLSPHPHCAPSWRRFATLALFAAAAPIMGKKVGSSPSVAPHKQPRKQPRELQGLGPILPYGPTHRGPTVTARKSTGPPAPKPPPGFRGFGCSSTCSLFDPPKMQANGLQVEAAEARGRPLKSNEAAGRSLASVARPPWQPQWTWLPLEDCGEFCFSTKWFWRTLAMARPSTGGPGTSADAAAKRQREWEQRQRDEGIVSGRQYGRWEQSATGSKRWRRGVPKEERPWDS